MKKKILLFLIMITFIVGSIYSLQKEDKIKINTDGISIIIPDDIRNKIIKELEEISDQLLSIIKQDTMDGYSLGLGSPSLSKEGVKNIYNYLRHKDICIDDIQGYYDLENRNVFEAFWESYRNKEDATFTYYSISQSGNIERSDYYFEDNILCVIYSELDFSNIKPQVINIYGEQIKNLNYENGFFYYQRIVSEWIKMYGGIEYDYIRIEPLGEINREYTQKYIGTIDYQCTNLFIEDWNEETINIIYFNDLLEYLYELKYDKPFYASEFNYSSNPIIKEIDAHFFEQLIREYFNASNDDMRDYSIYNKEKDIYYWNEACCVPSKLETPQYVGEVINIEKNNEYLTLTVQVHGYEFGFSNGFKHKIYIKNSSTGYQYIGNEIIKSNNNNIPIYTPGVTQDSIY